MSERPFMQLYVSDFIGDTLHLSTEQVGAYLLLLMAMWNAGGSLPNDDVKLARVARLSLKKWRAVAGDLLPFFEVENDRIAHGRLTKELQKSESKSQSRAAAGAEGGRAKALKDRKSRLANATPEPQHLPDTRDSTSSLRSDVRRAKRAERLPADWRLPDDWRQDAVDAGLAPQRIDVEAATMLDWSRSAPGGAKLDWRATWRNWCRRASDRPPQPIARGSPKPPTAQEILRSRRESFNHDEPAPNGPYLIAAR